MWDMSESLGLSIGVANLVATRAGGAPLRRASVLHLFQHQAAEVGLPEENPGLAGAGLVLRGFVERVGDQSPLIAADGTKYLGEALAVQALSALARTVGYGSPVTIAAPAYWSGAQLGALRGALLTEPALAPNGVAAAVVSDAAAALAALRPTPGFPASGVVALCDFGAGGTSVTLAQVGSSLQQIGPTFRYREFSGDEIDQLILSHLLTVTPGIDSAEVSGTATSMGSVTLLLGGCRFAKEHLSAAPVATIATGAAGQPGADIRFSRNELEQLITQPLDRFIGSVEDMLQRSGVPRPSLAAVAAVGGGAAIPLIGNRLSERLQVPVFTTAQPIFSAAIGAAMLGQDQSSAGAPTGAGPAVDMPTNIVGAAGTIGAMTEVSPTAWANQAGSAAASESASDNAKSATYRALAWSQDADTGNEPVPYTGPDATGEYGREPATDYAPRYDYPDQDRYAEAAPLPWYKRAAVVFSLAAAGLAILVAVVLGLTLGTSNNKPVNTTVPAPPPEPITTTILGPNSSPTVTVITPTPPSTTTTSPSATTTTTQPTTTTTTTTTPTTTTTTTTTPPTTTTTQPTTTRTTTTQPTTTAPPTTTQQPSTTTAAPITPTTEAPGA
ncbi:hypothetical protein NJB1507_05550 [Mycobacterium marinum]|nr:hypothetical protein NJB1507_05550 [Mycobacterium marinum]